MYTDNTFESCKGFDFELVDDLHEIEEKDRVSEPRYRLVLEAHGTYRVLD
jgi:hypothetical protein